MYFLEDNKSSSVKNLFQDAFSAVARMQSPNSEFWLRIQYPSQDWSCCSLALVWPHARAIFAIIIMIVDNKWQVISVNNCFSSKYLEKVLIPREFAFLQRELKHLQYFIEINT